jgi:hypothetical protein
LCVLETESKKSFKISPPNGVQDLYFQDYRWTFKWMNSMALASMIRWCYKSFLWAQKPWL